METNRAVPIVTETSGKKKNESRQSNGSLFLYFLKIQIHQQLNNFLSVSQKAELKRFLHQRAYDSTDSTFKPDKFDSN